MRRFLLTLALVILLTAACDRPIPQPTPTATLTAAPTVEPTPTRETVLPVDTLNCNTLAIHRDFPPINPDPCLRGPTQVTRLVYSPDARHQAYPQGYNPTITVGDAGAPFWVNVSTNPRGYRMEITEVNGSFGYDMLSVVYVGGTRQAPRRYIVKVGAVLDLRGVGALQTVSVSGDVHIDLGGRLVAVPLRAQPMPFTNGYSEWIWILEVDDLTSPDDLTTMTVGAQFNIQYADCTGSCFITWQQIAVLQAPGEFGGPEDVIDVP